jgi:hypothetical protein
MVTQTHQGKPKVSNTTFLKLVIFCSLVLPTTAEEFNQKKNVAR